LTDLRKAMFWPFGENTGLVSKTPGSDGVSRWRWEPSGAIVNREAPLRPHDWTKTTVGDAYDNAMAENVAWFDNERLHESIGDVPPAEFEDLYVRQEV
jgi:transposase InsO family protein